MPVVPGPRVSTAALPGARVSTGAPSAAFGTGATLDLSAPVELAAKIHAEHARAADQVAILDADNQLSEHAIQLRSRAMQLRGKDAMGALNDTAEQWAKSTSEISETLAEHQRPAFQARAQARWASLHEAIEVHANAEGKAFDDQTTEGALANRTNDAIANYRDPQKVSQAIAESQAVITDWGRRNGVAPELVKAKLDARTSGVHLGVIEQLLSAPENEGGGDLRASAYLKEHRADLKGDDLVRAEKLTDAGSVLGESQRQADTILRTAPELSDGLQAAAKIEDPRVRDATEHRVRQGFLDKAADVRQAQMQAFHEASAIVEKTGSFDAIPLSTRITMSPEENGALQHRVDQIRHPKEPGDPDTYFHLLNLASLSPESRTQFLKENLTPAGYPNLSSSERQKLMTLQRQLSVRSEGATETHQSREMLREAEAEQQRTDHLTEAALRKTDPAAAEVLRAENFKKRQAKYHGVGAAVPGTPAAPAGPSAAHPLAGLLTPTQKPTRTMLDDVAKKGEGYAAYLRSMGYDVPKGTPTHPVTKP